MFKPFYCCFGLFFRRTSFCSSRSVHPALQAVLCLPCIANVLNFLIQRRPTRTLFYSNFQGFTYCSIFDFQGSLLLSVSAATRSVYQMLFCLSTTFLFIFSNFFEVRLPCFTRRVLTLSYLLVVVKQKFLFFYFRVKKIITWK